MISARGVPLIISLVTGVILWQLAAGTLFTFLPQPVEVARAFAEALSSEEFFGALGVTFRRVVIGWVGAYSAALLIGIWMGRNWIVETIAHPWVFIGLAIPGPVTILFSILVLGLGELTSLAALWAMVTPFVVTFVYDGTKALDVALFEMGDAYRFSTFQQIRHIIVPQLAPSLMAGARFGFAMSWKLVVLVEALSAQKGIGERIHFFFTFNEPAAVLAWTFSFTIVMILVEIFVFQTMDRRLFAWRPRSSEG